MNKKISNSDVYLLVLGRPADPLCTLLSAFLSGQPYPFSVCSSIYQALGEMESACSIRQVILVARPAMLMSQAASFLARQFPDLPIISWLDANENLSTLAAARGRVSGVTIVSSCDQLLSVIQSLETVRVRQFATVPDTKRIEISDNLDPMEYKLCDDEMNALLGVE